MDDELNADKMDLVAKSFYILKNFVHNSSNNEASREINSFFENISDFFEIIYGQFLGKYIVKEWELISKEEMLDDWENEHGQSLALIMTNENQRIQLEELNDRLNHEIHIRKEHEKKLLELKLELEEKNKELEHISLMDGLTGVANRRYFDIKLAEEWNRSLRTKTPLSLIMFDIDFFKPFNDTYGHIKGDDCLKQLARRLQNLLKRAGEIVARYGGEEFAIILPQTSMEDAKKTALFLQNGINELKIVHEKSTVAPYVTVSMGIACIVPKKPNLHLNLIRGADHALYQAKRQGRNRICVSK
jgi:diguanylate cyclase (GGDEF)-like protein